MRSKRRRWICHGSYLATLTLGFAAGFLFEKFGSHYSMSDLRNVREHSADYLNNLLSQSLLPQMDSFANDERKVVVKLKAMPALEGNILGIKSLNGGRSEVRRLQELKDSIKDSNQSQIEREEEIEKVEENKAVKQVDEKKNEKENLGEISETPEMGHLGEISLNGIDRTKDEIIGNDDGDDDGDDDDGGGVDDDDDSSREKSLAEIEIEKGTEEMVRARRRSWESMLSEKRGPVVVCVFYTTNGLAASKIWQQWYESFMELSSELNFNGSDYLRGVLEVSRTSIYEEVRSRIPKWLRDFVDPSPAEASWGKLLASNQRGFQYALEKHPDADYFLMISDTTVPFKPFFSIWNEIAMDSRTRVDCFCLDHKNSSPKHSQWLMLNRSHVDLLATRDQWLSDSYDFVSGDCQPGFAASDEFNPVNFLRENDANFDGNVIMRTKDEDAADTLNWWTFVDWFGFKERKKAIGDLIQVAGHPGRYLILDSQFVRSQVLRNGVWFFRKITFDPVRVLRCSLSPLQTLSNMVGVDDLGSFNFPEANRPKEDHCSLDDFLPALLHSYYSYGLQQIITV